MASDNNCPLRGQTVGQLAYALAGKAQLCTKHWAASHREIDAKSITVEPLPYQKAALDALMDPATERVSFASRTTPIAATQPLIGGK